MDSKTNAKPEAEYKFSESDVAPAAPVAQRPVGTSSPDFGGIDKAELLEKFKKNINQRKFIVPAIFVAAIFFIYFILSFFSAKEGESEQRKMQVQEQVAKQQSMNATLPPPSQTQAQPQQILTGDQIDRLQDSVKQDLDVVMQEVSVNRDQVLDLRKEISKAQKDVSDVGQNVGQLAVTMQELLSEIQKLKAPKVKPKKKVSKPIPIYHVRAIVPGRAWLESDKGRGVTLRVGDHLEGYGTVEVVAPRHGMVLMSNGSAIQYGVNDF